MIVDGFVTPPLWRRNPNVTPVRKPRKRRIGSDMGFPPVENVRRRHCDAEEHDAERPAGGRELQPSADCVAARASAGEARAEQDEEAPEEDDRKLEQASASD